MKKLLLLPLIFALSSCCLAQKAANKTLLPAIDAAWVDVERDVAAVDEDLAQTYDAALQARDVVPMNALLPNVGVALEARVTAQLEAKEVGEGVAQSIRERNSNFKEAVTTYLEAVDECY